ncbi:MAG: hypothetical protein RL662_2400 [Bacteroidota bacterium]|jgi:HD superfamily phosphohydrolase
MKKSNRIINDPVFGFIVIPNDFIANIIDHPYFQRLRRIKQLGMASFAFPGAQHTRFLHSLGAMYLMNQALLGLRSKGTEITDQEINAALVCILLHDVGHGPFSHVLEHTITNGVQHEYISLQLMCKLNEELNGQLDICISIFKNEYPKTFLHQLVSGQLDVDRLDYLRRDCFFTGVSEGDIGSERIIKLLDVRNNNLVVESKGIYSIENFLLSRRLMYWQVYHHKTAISAENVLVNTLRRAKYLICNSIDLFAPPSLLYFLQNDITAGNFDDEALQHFINLDDSDIYTTLKVWRQSSDRILALLSQSYLDRNLFKIELLSEPVSEDRKQSYVREYMASLHLSADESLYLISAGSITTNLYNQADRSIEILYKNGEIKNIADVSDLLNIQLLSKKAEKYYFSYLSI